MSYDAAALARTHGPITNPDYLASEVFEYGENPHLFPGERYALVVDDDGTGKAIIYGHVPAETIATEFAAQLDGYQLREDTPVEHEHVLILAHSPECPTGTAGRGCGCGGEEEPWCMLDAPANLSSAVPVTIVEVAEVCLTEVQRYASVRKVRGDELKLGDWLDSLDHCGARMIYGIWFGNHPDLEHFKSGAFVVAYRADESPFRTVMFSLGDTEVVRADVEYDVVDPNSLIAPDGCAR